jgi:hypothetical protein
MSTESDDGREKPEFEGQTAFKGDFDEDNDE